MNELRRHDGRRKRSNMHEVADLAGVAISSVSRVLSDHPDVSAVMRDRVLAAVRELEYEPDFLAQSLRRGATLSVGYVIGDISNPLIATITSGAESELRGAGYSMLLMNSENDPELDAAHTLFFLARRVDGIILSLANERRQETLDTLAQSDVPIVVVDRDVPSELDASIVRSDHRGGMRTAITHLLELGHRRIAMIAGPLELWPVRERIAGMSEAVQAFGVADETITLVGSLSAEHGERSTTQVLAMEPRPTAIVAGGNQVLSGCVRAFARSGIRLPQDMSLVTCDEVDLSELHSPPIAAIARDTLLLGRTAAQLLLERLGGGEPRTQLLPHLVRFPPELRTSPGYGLAKHHMTRVLTIEAIPVSYPEPNDFDALRHLCLVKTTTDDGIVGWGEAVTMFPEASFATRAVIEGMAARVVGRDPLDISAIWHDLHDQMWWYGYNGGIASYAVAAIDISLWDITGKLLGVPVVQLLGGAVHDRLPAIASSHAHYEDIGQMVEEAQAWVAPGLHGLKVGLGKRGNARLGYDHDRDVEYMRRMREGLPDKSIMLDCGWNVRWDVSTAVRRVQAFDEYDLSWIEEPLGAWDPEGYANLRSKTTCLIAYGEKEWNVEGFARILATGTVDVVGIDPGRSEGITGFKRATERVEAARRQANAHCWSSAIVTAASHAVSFSSPAFKVIEVKPLRNPMQHELVANPIEHVDGWFEPPTRPGLGIDVIEEVVDRYRTERVLA